jgi:hypothetical protein
VNTTTLEIENPSATTPLRLYSQYLRAPDEAPEIDYTWQDNRCIGNVKFRIPERIPLQSGRRIILSMQSADDFRSRCSPRRTRYSGSIS